MERDRGVPAENSGINRETPANVARHASQMSKPYFSRRELLGITGAGILATSATTYTVSAQEDTSGGDEIWFADISAHSLTAPTVVDGTVFVGSDSRDVHAVDAGTGNRKWRIRTEGLGNTAPHVVDSTVFIGNRNRSKTLQRATVYALDANDGNEQRTYTFGDDNEVVWSSPTVADGTVFVPTFDSGTYALNATDGTEQWQFESGSRSSSPTVVDDTVFIGGSEGLVYALDVATGEQQWDFEVGNRLIGSPTFADNTVFVRGITESNSPDNLTALDADTGDERWTFRSESDLRRPTVADSTVFFAEEGGNIHALDAATGDENWNFEPPYGLQPPTVADGICFAAGGGYEEPGIVYAIDAETGTEQWSVEVDYTFRTMPIVVDGVLFIGDIVGNLYAFAAGVEGSSEGSRVNLGTHNHHDEWADNQSGIPLAEPADNTAGEDSNQEYEPSDNTADVDSRQEDKAMDNTEDNKTEQEGQSFDNTAGDAGPGFGVGGAIAGIASVVFLLHRRITGKETESE